MSRTCTLSLANVTTNLAGRWSVTVTNLGGITTPTYSTNAELVVLLKPTITRQPQGQTVDPGSSASFTVAAQGSAPLSYQWFLNGNPVDGATQTNLLLASVGAAEQGSYTVVVTNLVGRVESAAAVLTVRLPRILGIQQQSGTVTLEWTSIPARSYRVQFKDRLEDPQWIDLPGDVLATEAVSRKTDAIPPGKSERYYRVSLLP
ncbi:MAG: hypothetical protein FJ405_14630 [Verrucomicrobia bacterium]|nr:hypothetical protein [Verrucomicrobiota bacterium]